MHHNIFRQYRRKCDAVVIFLTRHVDLQSFFVQHPELKDARLSYAIDAVADDTPVQEYHHPKNSHKSKPKRAFTNDQFFIHPQSRSLVVGKLSNKQA